MNALSRALQEYLNKNPPLPPQNPLEQMSYRAPGMCIISSNYAMLRRRLLISIVMFEIMRQIDPTDRYAQLLDVHANGSPHAMLKDLLALDSGVDLSKLTLLGSEWVQNSPKSLEECTLLSIAGGFDPTEQNGVFKPLQWKTAQIAFTELTTTVQLSSNGTVHFVENIHLVACEKGISVLQHLTEIRQIAAQKGSTVYIGALALPGNRFDEEGKSVDHINSSVNPAETLCRQLEGVDAIADALVYLEMSSSQKVFASRVTTEDFARTHRL